MKKLVALLALTLLLPLSSYAGTFTVKNLCTFNVDALVELTQELDYSKEPKCTGDIETMHIKPGATATYEGDAGCTYRIWSFWDIANDMSHQLSGNFELVDNKDGISCRLRLVS